MSNGFVLVHLVSKKEGLTLSQFRKHNEEHFVPLVNEICGTFAPLTWTRRYLAEEEQEAQRKPGALGLPRLLLGRKEEVGWDSLGEMTFTDELHFQQFFAIINEEKPAERLLEEEQKFSDTSKLKIIVMEASTSVNMHRTPLPTNAPNTPTTTS